MDPCGALLFKTIGFYCVICVLFKWFISRPLHAFLLHVQQSCAMARMDVMPFLAWVQLARVQFLSPPAPLCQHPGGEALSHSTLTGLMRSQVRWSDFRRSPEIQKPWLKPTNVMRVCNSSFSLAVALLHHATAWGCEPAEQPAKSVVFVDGGNSRKALLQVFGSNSLASFALPFQTDVVLQLDLHYTQLSTKQRTCESLQTTLQKSLLGQFFSQRNYSQPNYQRTPACSGSVGLQDALVLSTDPKGQASLRTGSGHSLPSNNPSHSSSEPEENDESDLSELCSALLRAGPGQDYP